MCQDARDYPEPDELSHEPDSPPENPDQGDHGVGHRNHPEYPEAADLNVGNARTWRERLRDACTRLNPQATENLSILLYELEQLAGAPDCPPVQDKLTGLCWRLRLCLEALQRASQEAEEIDRHLNE